MSPTPNCHLPQIANILNSDCVGLLTVNCKLRTAMTAAADPKLHGGGISRDSRRIRVISAANSEPSALQNSQFSGISPASRLSFRREYCKFCTKCNKARHAIMVMFDLPITVQNLLLIRP